MKNMTIFNNWNNSEIPPLPEDVCQECCGEGQLMPELTINGQYILDDNSESASCITCLGTGSNDVLRQGQIRERYDIVEFIQRRAQQMAIMRSVRMTEGARLLNSLVEEIMKRPY